MAAVAAAHLTQPSRKARPIIAFARASGIGVRWQIGCSSSQRLTISQASHMRLHQRINLLGMSQQLPIITQRKTCAVELISESRKIKRPAKEGS